MLPEATGRISRLTTFWSRNERQLQAAALAGAVGLGVAIWLLRGTLASMKVVGYPGVLFFSFLGSSAMLLPLPGLLTICGASLLLAPLAVGLVGAVGETLGELSGYAVGYGGQSFVENRRFYIRVRDWMETRGTLVLFIVSAIPNPVFDVVGIAAGATRYNLRRFLAVVFVGKTIKSVAVAEACFYGSKLVPWLN